MEYILVIEAGWEEQAKDRVLSLLPQASINRTTFLLVERYAVRISIPVMDEAMRSALEGALNSCMGDTYLVWWNRVTEG